jgi:fibronectin-binding autotransporter adhesin
MECDNSTLYNKEKKMKTRKLFVAVTAMAILIAPFAQAADLTWDHDGNGTASDGTGTWLTANRWLNGGTPATWNNSTPDNAIIGSGGAGGTITVGAVTAGSVTLTNFTGTYTLQTGTNSQSGGITIAPNAGNVTFTSCSIQGAGGITKYGTSTLILGTAASANTFTGQLRVLGGVVKLGQDWNNHNNAIAGGYIGSVSGPNIELNGGVLGLYYDDFDRTLGTGAGQFQITGGRSGFAMYTNPRTTTTFNNNSSYQVVWGASGEGTATGYFNPSVFVLGDSAAGGGENCVVNNPIDLNGANRTIETANTSYYGQLSGVIANSTGTAGLIKLGAGELQLTQANTFNGGVTVSNGTLTVSSLANGGSNSSIGKSSNAATNLVLANGTTLKYTGGAASSDRSFTFNGTADGNSVTLNASGSGAINLTSTATPALGTANQTRTLILTGTQTGANTLAANLANNGTGVLAVKKTGAGTWVLTGNNTHTGQTSLEGGLLGVGTAAGLGASSAPVVFNGGGLQITGTTLTSLSSLGRQIVVTAGQPLILDIANAANTFTVDQALPPDGLVISGAGTVTLQGVVSNLVLNVPSGVTATYSGVIANGASGMSVTKIGAGTQILTGNNTYTGETYLNVGSLTLGSGSTIGRITGTTGLIFNGGTLQFNRSTNADIDAINNSAAITVNRSSTFGVTSADAGGINANENIGAATLNAGQMNFNWSNGGSSGTIMTLASLSRSGTASANFNSGFASNSSRWRITGSGTTTAGEIVGPWYTTGGNGAGFNSTDYAVYSSDFVAPAAITANNTETTWGIASNIHVNATATTLTATRTLNTLRYSAAAGSVALGANNLETYGLLNGGSGLLTVSGTGALTTPSGGGNLYVTAGANSITVSAPINNNGGDVTLVKNGGNTLTLSGSKNYAGGTVLNAGSLTTTADNQLGTGGVTVNGTVTWNSGDIYNHARSLTINEGAELTLNNGSGVTGVFSGNGRLKVTTADAFRFLNASNTFSGPIYASTANVLTYGLEMASIGDGVGSGLISLDNGNFRWMKASGGTTTLANRQFALSGTTSGGTIQALGTTSAENLIINKDLLVTGVGNKTFRLAGSNTGNNWFAGNITDGPSSIISLTKEEGGTWILSGTNTYSGTTIVLAGKLILSNAWSVASGVLDVRSGAKVQLDYTGSRPVAEFWTNGVKAASGIVYNSVNAPNHILGSGSIMVGIETFSVSYNGNGNTGGAVPVDPNAYTNNAIVTVLGAGTLVKANSSFGGWSMQAGPTYAPGSTFQITTNTTLYATWMPAGTLIQLK